MARNKFSLESNLSGETGPQQAKAVGDKAQQIAEQLIATYSICSMCLIAPNE
jgi:hypothetical protein